MKITRDERFNPITLVIESKMELDMLCLVLGDIPTVIKTEPLVTIGIEEHTFLVALRDHLEKFK